MLKLFRKTIAVCLIGFGLRSVTCNITSIFRLAVCHWNNNSSSRSNLALLLKSNPTKIKESVFNMTIVVKKVPKFLRGIVKLIFGVK